MPLKVKKKTKRVRVGRKKRAQHDEVTALGRALRGLGSLGGGALGSFIGQGGAGASIGHNLGAALSKWMGSGDYTVNSNSMVKSPSGTIPMMHKTAQSVVIRHREFVKQISATTGFSVEAFIINPGLAATFPWLSGIARRFQEYEIRGMVWHYVPTSGSAVSSTNSALGAVMMQTSYRATDSAPSSKQELLNEYWASESVPSETFCHPIECDPKENPFQVHYVRSVENLIGTEPLLYDMGKTFVATQGMQGTNVVGDLWVTYEIELKKPVLASSVVTPTEFTSISFPAPAPAAIYQNEAIKEVYFGGIDLKFNLGSTVTFGANTSGVYNIFVYVYLAAGFTGQVQWASNPSFTGNCSLSVTATLGGQSYWNSTMVGTVSTSLNSVSFAIAVAKTPGAIGTVQLPTATWTGTAEYASFVAFKALDAF
jgi:hypothetical protein